MAHRLKISYARARLYLGIGNVGFWVLLAASGLLFQWGRFLPGTPGLDRKTVLSLALLLVGYVLLQAPFDWLGGYFLPRGYGRFLADFSAYITAWARGVCVQGLLLFAIGLSILGFGQWSFAVAVGWTIGLLFLQSHLAFWMADLRARGKDRLKSFDEAFTGGVVGFPGFQKSFFNSGRDRFGLSIDEKRRAYLQVAALPIAGLIIAGTFNLIGILLISQLIRFPANTLGGLAESSFWFTLWSFLGLLSLPSLSRPAVYAADYSLFERGISEEDFRRFLSGERSQSGELGRSFWVETIFHPIPSIENRLARWGQPPGWAGGWHAARYAIYLSWSGLSLLGRSVHCNIGKPDLWVMLPCD